MVNYVTLAEKDLLYFPQFLEGSLSAKIDLCPI